MGLKTKGVLKTIILLGQMYWLPVAAKRVFLRLFSAGFYLFCPNLALIRRFLLLLRAFFPTDPSPMAACTEVITFPQRQKEYFRLRIVAPAMFYLLVRPVARYVLRYYFRNIDLTGLDKIPPNAAVILAANHPTAFIEPCILACFQPRTLWFLARGNLFKNGLFKALLNAVNILPVFRLEDGGYGKLKNNFETFDACYQALSRRRAIMILAEGRCIHEKALRPLRKGTARIALGALDRDPSLEEVYIVPIGANFTNGERVRSQVMVRCGDPILASSFLEEYRQGEAAAIKNLTKELRAQLSPLIVQFPDQDRAGIGEARLVISRAQHGDDRSFGITHDGSQLDRELMVASTTPPDDPALTRVCNRIDRHRLNLGAAAGALFGNKQGEVPIIKVILAAFFILPQFPLWALAELIGAKMPKHVEFYSPVRFAVVAGGTFLLYPLALILLPWLCKIWLLTSILTTGWSVRQLEKVGQWYERRKIERMVDVERQRIKTLLQAVKL